MCWIQYSKFLALCVVLHYSGVRLLQSHNLQLYHTSIYSLIHLTSIYYQSIQSSIYPFVLSHSFIFFYNMFLLIYQQSESGLVDLSQKKDSVIANGQILKSFLQSPEQARELQLRLDNISFLWQQLQEKIQERICELKFEWTQSVSQNIHTYNVCEGNWSGDFCITIRAEKKVQRFKPCFVFYTFRTKFLPLKLYCLTHFNVSACMLLLSKMCD